MRKILFLLTMIILFSCEKDEPIPIFDGNWELVRIDIKRYFSNDYTGDWYKLNMEMENDTLKYDYKKGINFSEVTTSTYKEILYSLKLNIDEDIIVSCNLTEIENNMTRDTIFSTDFEEGNFDNTFGGGGKYDVKIEFGVNNFYIIGLSDSFESNILYAIKDEIVNDTLVLQNYHQDYQPSSYLVDYKYFFRKVSN